MASTALSELPQKGFSGANIYATIGNRRVGTLQAITVSITREVAALYSFSDPNPKSFVKGKRGIAGSLVFTQFDRHALMQDIFKEAFNKRLGDDFGNLFSSRFVSTENRNGQLLNQELLRTRNFGHGIVDNANAIFGEINPDLAQELKDVYQLVADQRFIYSDQIPLFDVTITMVNEEGHAAFCVVGGVQLVNEGWGYTLDDLVSEVAFTYVARSVTPLTSLEDPRKASGLTPGNFSFNNSGVVRT